MLTKDSVYDSKLLEAIIDYAYEWIVVVDNKGTIVYINRNYCSFLGVDRDRVIGQHVTEVIENTRMHIVVTTGKEEIADLQYIKGNYMIANRIPFFSGDKVIGAIGTVIFRDTKEWKTMNSHIRNVLFSELPESLFVEKELSGVKYSLHDIIGSTPQTMEIKEQIKKVSDGDITVLIRGESGTGKELVAHSIHLLSSRSNKPFVKVNCGAIPHELLESELFGYEEGSFTGAKRGGKKGKFLLADGGTIFLDEIGDLPLHMQVKLLRALQEREIEPIGSVKPIPINVRVIAATNRPLEKMMEENKFREDLFYRIHVMPIQLIPLRDRIEDLSSLIPYFIKKMSKKIGKRVNHVSEDVLQLFSSYTWPGNIRELENVIEAAIHLTRNESVTMDALPPYLLKQKQNQTYMISFKEEMDAAEKKLIQKALQASEFDKMEAAKLLNMSKSSFYEKVKKHSL
ncbi:sigma-54 interaction domain-containing protein [Bacillus suaedaesalsae]|uniref:Sigma 54-interacting transcriptional regulator n=1 Tax=Bacillus suaedaesalsae TaxID=2810349 RepID=A0ABS2DP49_9BACI|nr:sigma 54-interacting transcriptional regulator [Bacillus suaedaesalsae]MBM6619393.1 sigma 54-interacting transcriptional regulator [Bacillus suaedaesalsae]